MLGAPPVRRLSKTKFGKAPFRYGSAAGSKKLRLEKDRLLRVAAENQRLLGALNRIYNGRRRSVDNGPHLIASTDASRFPQATHSAVVPHIEIGRSTQLSREAQTGTAARHSAIVAAARNAIAASETRYLGTLSLPLRCVGGFTCGV